MRLIICFILDIRQNKGDVKLNFMLGYRHIFHKSRHLAACAHNAFEMNRYCPLKIGTGSLSLTIHRGKGAAHNQILLSLSAIAANGNRGTPDLIINNFE